MTDHLVVGAYGEALGLPVRSTSSWICGSVQQPASLRASAIRLICVVVVT